MDVKSIPIKDLKFADYNPRIITENEYKGLKKSLGVFGLVDPIIINKDYTIIGGHQRCKAWNALGNETIPCFIMDLDKKLEKKLNIILNSQAISGKYDELKLSEILEEFKLDDDYFDLKLNELEGFNIDQDFSDKNQEISMESLGDESVLKLKFDMQTYLNVMQILNDLRVKNDFKTNEELFLNLISYDKV